MYDSYAHQLLGRYPKYSSFGSCICSFSHINANSTWSIYNKSFKLYTHIYLCYICMHELLQHYDLYYTDGSHICYFHIYTYNSSSV